MGQVRHRSAKTTVSVRPVIQRSQALLAQLSRKQGIMSCCRFLGHEDKIVTKELESGNYEAEVQPRVQDQGRKAGAGSGCNGGASRPWP